MFLEVHFVAHAGTSAAGRFVQAMVVTDIATGWTERGRSTNRAQQLATYSSFRLSSITCRFGGGPMPEAPRLTPELRSGLSKRQARLEGVGKKVGCEERVSTIALEYLLFSPKNGGEGNSGAPPYGRAGITVANTVTPRISGAVGARFRQLCAALLSRIEPAHTFGDELAYRAHRRQAHGDTRRPDRPARRQPAAGGVGIAINSASPEQPAPGGDSDR
jgi:hypothetical protein